MNPASVVTVDWLQAHINDSDIRIVDASWHLPPTGRNGHDEFLVSHIPGAVHFDIDQCITVSDLPHTLPSAATFAQYAGERGINEQHHVVVYDSQGWFSAARAWWMFQHFGCDKVSVLDGGMAAWKAKDYSVHSGAASVSVATFKPSINTSGVFKVVGSAQVLEASQTGDTHIADARGSARFHATEPEFRPGLRSGHIPSSINVPFSELINDGFMRSDEELLAIFTAAGLTQDKPVIGSCGSGVTAAIVLFALQRVGFNDLSLYDGSWTEWGSVESLPIVPS